jgi:hypothetical protein
MKINLLDRNSLTGPKRDSVEYGTIFPKREFAVGSAFDIVENNLWNTAAGQQPEIVNVHHSRRGNRTRTPAHAAKTPPPSSLIVTSVLSVNVLSSAADQNARIRTAWFRTSGD